MIHTNTYLNAKTDLVYKLTLSNARVGDDFLVNLSISIQGHV